MSRRKPHNHLAGYIFERNRASPPAMMGAKAHGRAPRTPTPNAMPTPKDPTRADIIRSMARTFWVCAWADYGDENLLPTAGGGEDLMLAAPDGDRGSLRHAAEAARKIEQATGSELQTLYAPFGDADASEDDFGHYLAMEFMGHGVGLSDLAHTLTGKYSLAEAFTVPYGEPYYDHSLSPADYA